MRGSWERIVSCDRVAMTAFDCLLIPIWVIPSIAVVILTVHIGPASLKGGWVARFHQRHLLVEPTNPLEP
jgi:hypothetical protein